MKRYYVFYNFGIMPEPFPSVDGYATREEAQSFIDEQTKPEHYKIVEMSTGE